MQPTRTIRLWQQHLLALLFYVVLTLWMLWTVVRNLARSLEGWGDALLQTWTLDWNAHALATNPLGLFNANAFYPYNNSLAFSESLIGQSLFVTPLIWLTDNPILAFNLLLLASFILSGWGMYLLAYELTGSTVAALAAGVIFAFFPHRFGQLSHLHLLATQWMPFCLLYLRRFMQDKRWKNASLFALFFALQALSSTYLGLFLAVAVGLYLIYHGVRWLNQIWTEERGKRKEEKPERGGKWRIRVPRPTPFVIRLVVVGFVAGLIVLPFYLPFLSVQSELGFERSPAEVINYSAAPNYFLDVAKENKLNQWFYNPTLSLNWWESGRGGERGLYLGALASVLGLVGLVVAWRQRKRERDSLFYALLALIAISFTFGPLWQSGKFGSIPLPYALLYYYVPGFQGLRVPVRFIYVVALAVAMLVAFTLAAAQRRWKLITWRKASFLAVPLIALLCLEYVSDVNYLDSDALRGQPPAINQWLAAQPPGAVLNVPLSGSDNSNLFYQYWSRVGWQPIMNGFSGFMPPAYDAFKKAWMADFPNPRLIELLQGIEVRYLVINSTDSTIKPIWERVSKGLKEKYSAQLPQVAQFGDTYVYEVKPNAWVRNFSKWIKPDDSVYMVSYNRNEPQLLELAGYFLQQSGVTKRDKLYGSMNVGFKPLPPLPFGEKAKYLLIQAGEDPTLYGFDSTHKLFGNTLFDLYQSDEKLIARYDFTRIDPKGALRGDIKRIFMQPEELKFNEDNAWVGSLDFSYFNIALAFAPTVPSKVKVFSKDINTTFDLNPGISIVKLNIHPTEILQLEDDKVPLVWAELYQVNAPTSPQVQYRDDVVLISANAKQDGSKGVANVRLVPGGQSQNYTATLDIYNYPGGSHPSGHYGYWSVAVPGNGGAALEYSLDLPSKQLTTKLNGQDTPNYPPDPKDFDIYSYGRIGDFRANLTVYAGDKLIGSVRLFDFTVLANGDRSNAANRRLTDFKGYDTLLGFMVLPKK